MRYVNAMANHRGEKAGDSVLDLSILLRTIPTVLKGVGR